MSEGGATATLPRVSWCWRSWTESTDSSLVCTGRKDQEGICPEVRSTHAETLNTGEWLSLSDATAVLPRPLYDVPFPVFSSLSAKPFRVDTLPQMSRLANGEKHLEHYLTQ